VLLSFIRIQHQEMGRQSVAVSENLYKTSMVCAGGRCQLHVVSLYSWSNQSAPSPPTPRPGHDMGNAPAIDEQHGLLYVQAHPQASSPISVFNLNTNTFDAPLPSGGLEGKGAELMCLHYDEMGARLGAIVVEHDGTPSFDSLTKLSLVSINVTSGSHATVLELPPLPAGLTVGRRAGKYEAMCAYSQAKGMLTLQLHKLDPLALSFCGVEELHQLRIDVRKGIAEPPTRVKLVDNLGPAGAGRSWRLVSPRLKYSI
jgi:hypothetical protein